MSSLAEAVKANHREVKEVMEALVRQQESLLATQRTIVDQLKCNQEELRASIGEGREEVMGQLRAMVQQGDANAESIKQFISKSPPPTVRLH